MNKTLLATIVGIATFIILILIMFIEYTFSDLEKVFFATFASIIIGYLFSQS